MNVGLEVTFGGLTVQIPLAEAMQTCILKTNISADPQCQSCQSPHTTTNKLPAASIVVPSAVRQFLLLGDPIR